LSRGRVREKKGAAPQGKKFSKKLSLTGSPQGGGKSKRARRVEENKRREGRGNEKMEIGELRMEQSKGRPLTRGYIM